MSDKPEKTKKSVLPWVIGAGIVLGLVILGSTPGNGSTGLSNSAQNSSTITPQQTISVSDLQIDNLQLSCGNGAGGAGYGYPPNCLNGNFRLSGQITNKSKLNFESINLSVKAYDCPGNTIDSSCTEVASDNYANMYVENGVLAGFPSGEKKEAYSNFSLAGIPPLQGDFLWSYAITGVFDGANIIPVTP